MLKKIFKILFITLGSLLLLLLLLVFLVGAGTMNGFLARTLSKQAGQSINGELNIGSLTGRVFSSFQLHDVSITHESDTLLRCCEIGIDYLLRGLLRKRIEIDLIHIKDLSLVLKQDLDSVWNFTKFIKPGKDTDTVSGVSGWIIILHDFRLDHLTSEISTVPDNQTIPDHLESNIRLNGSISGDSISVDLESLNIITRNPDFELSDMSGDVTKIESILAWQNVKLKLNNSVVNTQGNFDPGEKGRAEIDLDLSPLSFDDLRAFFPDLKIFGDPQITVTLDGNEDEYKFDIHIIEEEQRISLEGWLRNYKETPEYLVNLSAGNLDGSHWTHDKKLKSDISGELAVRGNGFDVKDNNVELEGKFGNIGYGDYSLNGLLIKAVKRKDRISGTLNSETYVGSVDMEYDLKDVFNDPAYDILLKYRDVNLDNIPGIDSIPTVLNGELAIIGKGTSSASLVANIVMRSDSSQVFGDPVGDFTLIADYNKGSYNFGLEDFDTHYFMLSAEGEGHIKKTNDITFILQPLDLSKLPIFHLPDIKATGQITGNVTGPADSLNARFDLDLNDIVYDSIRLQHLDARIHMGITGKLFGTIRADLMLKVSDSLSTSFTGSVEGFDNPLVRISQLGIDFKGSEWKTGHDSAWVRLNEDHVFVNSFILNSGDQNIQAHGRFAFKGEEDMNIGINRLNLQTLPIGGLLPYEISGIINSQIQITGTSGEPVIKGMLSADELEMKDYRIDSIRSDLNYEDEMVSFTGTVNTGLTEVIEVTLKLPMRLSLNDSIAVLKDNTGFEASVRFDSLDLEKVFALFPVENTTVSGFANADVSIGNKLNDPVIAGTFSFRNGAFENSEYGVKYGNIQLVSSLADSLITIREFSAATGKGKLDLKGSFSLISTDSLEQNIIELNLKATDFQAIKSNSVELKFDSDINIAGPLGNTKFEGGMTVNSSKINVDYLGESLSQKTDDPDPPLLIAAMIDTVTVNVADTLDKGSGFSGSAIYKNLNGELVLDIPGNTWVTGKDMNFELEGTLRGVKSKENINLFGELNVKRGYYKIYGRSFNFSSGKITFTGGSEFNPEVDFGIIYSFRDIEKELRELKLFIKGKMMKPGLSFMLDDEAIEEKDAISYIVFGKSVNQLGDSERSKLSGENIAMGAALTQLSGVLKDVLQESVGVDVFEVTGGDDWKSGNVTIGKYITNKLFLSYDRSFNFDQQSKTPVTEKIMLEYQLLRKLIFKATNQNVNSGFDLIFKKTWR